MPKLLTRTNLEMLSALAEQEYSLRELAERLKCSPAKIHQAAKIFKRHGLILTERRRNRLFLKPDRKSPLYQRIKALINISRITGSKTYLILRKTGRIGVYGSYAAGTDEKESDVDLLIVTEKKELALRKMIRALEEELEKKVNILVLTKEQLASLEKTDREFSVRLRLTTISLNGEIFG